VSLPTSWNTQTYCWCSIPDFDVPYYDLVSYAICFTSVLNSSVTAWSCVIYFIYTSKYTTAGMGHLFDQSNINGMQFSSICYIIG
jgi:hypothetical protein